MNKIETLEKRIDKIEKNIYIQENDQDNGIPLLRGVWYKLEYFKEKIETLENQIKAFGIEMDRIEQKIDNNVHHTHKGGYK